jgi:glycosyltransferase involved in cell wall biosynthesis
MRVGLVSTAVPLINGGGRFIVDWLHIKLREHGHEVETIYLPFTEERDHILPQMAAFRTIDLESHFDRIVAIRPPAHVVRHPRKVVWFIHHLRVFYDLWGTRYCPHADTAANRALRDSIVAADAVALGEAHRLFTNSRVVGDRLRRFNGIDSEPLFPPILTPELFRAGAHGDEIVSVCRVEHHKRQHLLVEAMAHTKTPVRLRLCGASANSVYLGELRESASALGVAERVTFDFRWISEEEKADALSTALASAYLPFDEDSYGYPTIEAAHAARCTVTTCDSGGVPEFVTHGDNGLVVAPEPAAIADAFDRLYADRALARRMGEAARARVAELGIDWETVIGRLLS